MSVPWKKIFTNWRILLLLLFVLFALVAIKPQVFGTEGIAIRSIALNSSAAQAGIQNPTPQSTPLAKERILALNGEQVLSVDHFYQLANALPENSTVRIQTNKNSYTLRTTERGLGLRVSEVPSSNLREGLDLEGGTRVLMKPAEKISEDLLGLTVDNLKERLNVYGLSDVTVRSASDLAGDKFILIEIAGVTEGEVRELLAKQGKFEAKIGNETVFRGGEKDITYVCRSAECSGIDPQRGCGRISEGYACSFFFAITLNPEAAQRQAEATRLLQVVLEDGQSYLSEPLRLFLDDKEVDSLRIAADLRGRPSTNIQISGSGAGRNEKEAIANTLQNMKKLQTVLVTGSLPVKLDIVKMDTISPALGQEFLDNVLLVGLVAIGAVIVVVGLRYRNLRLIVPMVFALLAEMTLVLGFAALVGWNLDLAAIAGIIIVAGTALNDQVVIIDELLRGEATSDLKRKVKNALFIIVGAFLINVSSMLPLFWAGAGLLRGFALTTIAGLSFGVLISRPAYAAIVEILLKE